MSQFRPLHELAAEKLIAQIRAGTSLLQSPTDQQKPNAAFNPFTGTAYRGISALYLNLQPYNDPRWLTLKQAGLMRAKVPKGTSGTRIVFYKTTERKELFGANGEQKLDANGKKMYQTIRLDKPVNETAWVFNAQQLKGMPTLEKSMEKHGIIPVDVVQAALKMMSGSGAKIAYGGKDAFYEVGTDTVQLPKMEDFRKPSQYAAVALYELAHREVHHQVKSTTAPEKQNSQDSDLKNELRAAISSALFYRQLGIAEPVPILPEHLEALADFVEKHPFELQLATIDAQKVIDKLNTYRQHDLTKAEHQAPKLSGLSAGDEIRHERQLYSVLAKHKNNSVHVENMDTGARLKLKPSDGLYQSLLETKNNPTQVRQLEPGNIVENETAPRSMMRR